MANAAELTAIYGFLYSAPFTRGSDSSLLEGIETE